VFVIGCVRLEAKAVVLVDEMLARFGIIVASGVTVGDYLTARWGHRLTEYGKDSSIGQISVSFARWCCLLFIVDLYDGLYCHSVFTNGCCPHCTGDPGLVCRTVDARHGADTSFIGRAHTRNQGHVVAALDSALRKGCEERPCLCII
jgi:hypothetical protein